MVIRKILSQTWLLKQDEYKKKLVNFLAEKVDGDDSNLCCYLANQPSYFHHS
jgi:hypothetical protein